LTESGLSMATGSITPQQLDAGAEAALASKSEELEYLLDILPSAVIVLDGLGVVSKANQVAVDMLDEPLIGQQWRVVIARAFEPRADDGHEISLKDGRRIQFVTKALEKQPGQLIVMTDLTETRRLQSRISHMEKLSSLGKMVASLAHQVRTPLSAAMLYAANLANGSLTPSAKSRFHGKLMDRLKDLEQQVNDMLLFARKGDQLQAQEISIQTLLTQAAQHSEAMLKQHQIGLRVSLPDPDLLVMGNLNALCSAVGNLIHNAIQAGASGIRLSGVQADAESLVLSVEDDGSGIDKALMTKISEPFFTTRNQGTGLGLAVVQSVAQTHQGSLSVWSEPGKGSRFCIHLPLHSVAQQDVAMQKLMGA